MILPDAPSLALSQRTQPTLSGDFETYEGFRALVTTYLDTDGADISPNLLDSLILIGEKRINREVRCREMEQKFALTVFNGSAPVPYDYLELKNAGAVANGRLHKIVRLDLEQFASREHSQLCMARDGDDFVFAVYSGVPVDGTVITGSYYTRFTPLKDRSGSLLDPLSASYQRLYAEHSDLYLYSALEDAESLIGRPLRSQTWKGRYTLLKQMLEMESQEERFSGSPMRMRRHITSSVALAYPPQAVVPVTAPIPGPPAPIFVYYPSDYGPADYVL